MTANGMLYPRPNRALHISLWIAQVLLAVAYGGAGFLKTFTPLPDLATSMAWVAELPGWLVRFIGIAELAGAAGMILPAATRILPGLTPLAALGFVAVQALAIPFHAMRGELGMSLPANLLLLGLSLVVLWGRWRRLPIGRR